MVARFLGGLQPRVTRQPLRSDVSGVGVSSGRLGREIGASISPGSTAINE